MGTKGIMRWGEFVAIRWERVVEKTFGLYPTVQQLLCMNSNSWIWHANDNTIEISYVYVRVYIYTNSMTRLRVEMTLHIRRERKLRRMRRGSFWESVILVSQASVQLLASHYAAALRWLLIRWSFIFIYCGWLTGFWC